MATAPLSRTHIASRTAAAVLGGYAFTWGLIAFGMALLSAAGMDFHDAEHLSYLIGLLVYLTVFLMAYAVGNMLRLWLVLAGGGAAMAAAASLIQSQLI